MILGQKLSQISCSAAHFLNLIFSYDGLVRIALFNCQKDPELCKRYGVKKFPTFLAFESARLIGTYEDEPSLDRFRIAIDEFLAHSDLKGLGFFIFINNFHSLIRLLISVFSEW